MITLQSKTHVPGLRGQQVLAFLRHCDDVSYQRWWPGTHLQLHILQHRPNELGDLVTMDEWIGNRRVRMKGVMTEVIPGKKLVWQLEALVRQPVWLVLDFEDDASGVTITHTIRAGFEGIGKLFDPVLRLWFSDEFAQAMDAHVHTEFALLGRLLGTQPARA